MRETQLFRSGAMNFGSGAINPDGAHDSGGAHPASFEAWQALVAPGDVFRHPREVLAHPALSRADKRAILASWASDACVLADSPGMRCLVGSRAEPVSVDAVLAALGELDRAVRRAGPARTRRAAPRHLRRLRRLADLHTYVRPKRRDDDDDPPPCPASVMPRPKTPPSTALTAAIPA
ncbi:hypothetical protein [Methylobacterium sp. J-092]|uniref:hypothetical protein n=1 Tax=Methylobacterium sp. J-092 TaxID=2836667 RepID=UPI001FB9111D|nr:hypothetical protein [Methylobacterium sp. J-092]MCJ2007642.1 hypothetical protein [Methylobacterium sp. J-092]